MNSHQLLHFLRLLLPNPHSNRSLLLLEAQTQLIAGTRQPSLFHLSFPFIVASHFERSRWLTSSALTKLDSSW